MRVRGHHCRHRGWCGCLSYCTLIVIPLSQHPHLPPRAVARRLGGGAGNIIETERGKGWLVSYDVAQRWVQLGGLPQLPGRYPPAGWWC